MSSSREVVRIAGSASAAALSAFQRIVSFALATTAFLVVHQQLSGSYRPSIQQFSWLVISALTALVTLGLYWWFIESSERKKGLGASMFQFLVALGLTVGMLVYWTR